MGWHGHASQHEQPVINFWENLWVGEGWHGHAKGHDKAMLNL